MHRAPRPAEPHVGGEVIDFEQALLDACPAAERRELMIEAGMLAEAFAPRGRRPQIEALARTLCSGARDLDFGRAHARRLAAALRRLARRRQVELAHGARGP